MCFRQSNLLTGHTLLSCGFQYWHFKTDFLNSSPKSTMCARKSGYKGHNCNHRGGMAMKKHPPEASCPN
ncbi:uncharacterized protein N7503_006859 [Penicillium pulvis]|uniref:uncharacterized protein n=1 Tax=Penicillium pulvis TaxID=1562058 RepID=UPI00254805DE|nr:uncharacterized protein N7503_006859 [Penicillium pulvis]KAJ5797563.1 hypothetical protein N7503_006859 [Penicillium pulvis]